MELHAIDALTGLRAALEAPEERRLDLFREGVMEPLRPFWEPFMGWMRQAPGADQGDPKIKTIEEQLSALDGNELDGAAAPGEGSSPRRLTSLLSEDDDG